MATSGRRAAADLDASGSASSAQGSTRSRRNRGADGKDAAQKNRLVDRLFRDGAAFDFFQAVRILERLQPKRVVVGRRGPLDREAVRFRALASLSFPPSPVYDISRPTREFPCAGITVTFLGLTGPSGVLPRHYTEHLETIRYKAKHKEKLALRDWFDIFNHRAISLFYRAWEKYRFFVPYEREEYLDAEPDPFTTALLSFVGIGNRTLRRRIAVERRSTDGQADTLANVDDQSLIHYGGLFAQQTRNVVGLQQVLTDYFQVHVEVQQFVGQWLLLDTENQSRLVSGFGNCELGKSVVVGERVWDVEGKFRIRVGPLHYDQFIEFLPDSSPNSHRKSFYLLSHLVRFYAGAEFDFDVQLVLRPDAAPPCRLGVDEQFGGRLGWNTWIRNRRPRKELDDVVLGDRELFYVDVTPIDA